MGNLVIMNAFTNTLDIWALYYFFRGLIGKPGKDNKTITILLSIVIIFSTLINTIAGLVNVIAFITMIVVLTLTLSWIFNKNKPLEVFILLTTGLVLMFIIELVIINGISIFFKIQPSILLQINYFRLVGIILSKIIFCLIIYLDIGRLKEMYNWLKQLSIYPTLILIIVNLFIVFMTFIFYSFADVNSNGEFAYILAMGIAAIIVSGVIVWIIKKMIDQQKKEFILQIKEKEYENQQIYFNHIQDVIQTLRAQRHDFNNYISTIYGLIQLEKLEEAKKYILNLSKDVSDLNEIVNVQHPVVGAVLNMKKEKAARSKIDFIADIDIPSQLPFDFVDMSTILGNLLDNAIEACEKISNTYTKIQTQIYIKDSYMIIKIENSKNNKIVLSDNKLIGYVTTKLDKENHGLGLKNVMKAVSKYDGIINVQDKGKEFLVDIALPIEESIVI